MIHLNLCDFLKSQLKWVYLTCSLMGQKAEKRVPCAIDRFLFEWRGIVEIHIRIMQPWKEGRTEWDSEAERQGRKGSGFSKGSAKREERIAQRSKDNSYTSQLALSTYTLLGHWWHAPSCFLSTSPTTTSFFFFFNEIGQLDKGQMNELTNFPRFSQRKFH